jgi:hypothetical protein
MVLVPPGAAVASRMLAGVVVVMAASGGMATVLAASAPAFSLDVAGPDWDYTGAEHLAVGTSGGCRQAVSDIRCSLFPLEQESLPQYSRSALFLAFWPEGAPKFAPRTPTLGKY